MGTTHMRRLLYLAWIALAPCLRSQVPSEFTTLYASIQSRLNGYLSSMQVPASNPATLIGAEASPADSYMAILGGAYYSSSVTPYLNALQSLGVRVVKFQIGFPLLYQPFYSGFLGQPDYHDYNVRLSFYQQLVADLHARGIKVVIQSVITPATGGTYTGDPLNLTTYFQSIDLNTYIAGRAANCLTVAQQLMPDYINVESEPDTEPTKAYRPELNDPATNLSMVQTILATLDNGGISGLHTTLLVAAGMGTWQANLTTFLTNYVGLPSLDVFDIHVHPINLISGADYLSRILTMSDAATAAGKKIGMDEDWMDKDSNSEIGVLDAATIASRNVWSFWAPLDQLFIQAMMGSAYLKHMAYLSFSVPDAFFAYIDYANTPGCPTPPSTVCTAAQWNTAETSAVNLALASQPVPLTSTGVAFRDALRAQALTVSVTGMVSLRGRATFH